MSGTCLAAIHTRFEGKNVLMILKPIGINFSGQTTCIWVFLLFPRANIDYNIDEIIQNVKMSRKWVLCYALKK